MQLKFRDQLLATLLLVGLLPAALISYQTFVHNSEQVKGFSIESAQAKVRAIASGLEVEFNQAKNYAELYARNSNVQSMNYDQFMPLLKSELTHLGTSYEKIIIGKPNGHFFNTAGANITQGGIRTFDDNDPLSKPKTIASRDYWQVTIKNSAPGKPATYTQIQ